MGSTKSFDEIKARFEAEAKAEAEKAAKAKAARAGRFAESLLESSDIMHLAEKHLGLSREDVKERARMNECKCHVATRFTCNAAEQERAIRACISASVNYDAISSYLAGYEDRKLGVNCYLGKDIQVGDGYRYYEDTGRTVYFRCHTVRVVIRKDANGRGRIVSAYPVKDAVAV